MKKVLTRRSFLRGAGGALVAAPLLESFATRAYGQTAQYPKRFVVFVHPQGMIMENWTPTGSGTNFQLSEILAPLEPFKSKIVVTSGIDNRVNALNETSNGHNAAARTLLTCMPYTQNLNANGTIKPRSQQVAIGQAAGPSIDQVIASRIGTTTRFRTLDCGIGGSRLGEAQMFSAGVDDPVTSESNPRTIFDRMFLDLDIGGEPPPMPSTRDLLRRKRGSVLDKVGESFTGLRERVSADDRARLDAHAQKVRELEMRLGPVEDPTVPLSCAQPLISLPGGYQSTNANFDNVSATSLIDETVMALACDLTRVGTLQFTNFHAPTFPWLGQPIPGQWDNWHAMIHEARNAGGGPAMIAVMKWYTEQFAYLLQQMSLVQEGDGTLLDHSLVLWVSDFGQGQAHNTLDLPIVLAGGLGGAMQTGRYVNFANGNTGDLYTSILNMFGFNDQTFGYADLCSGPLAGLA